MKKNPSWAKLGKILLARLALSLLGEKVFKHESRERVAVSAVKVCTTNPVYFVQMETPKECPLEKCPSPLSCHQIASSHSDHCRELSKNPKLWGAEISGYSLLNPQY